MPVQVVTAQGIWVREVDRMRLTILAIVLLSRLSDPSHVAPAQTADLQTNAHFGHYRDVRGAAQQFTAAWHRVRADLRAVARHRHVVL